MIFFNKIKENAARVKNFLCVGIDPILEKIPNEYTKNNKGLKQYLIDYIEATQAYCVTYKANIAFFEGMGLDGLRTLEYLMKHIPKHIPVILDAKRGDIGNTSKLQAKYIFDYFGADAVTLHPYMGEDSLSPFFEYKDKAHFVLAYTSNPGAEDFESQKTESGLLFSELVAKKCLEWYTKYTNIGLVVGATHQHISRMRKVSEDLIFLMPGVGTQGASYKKAYTLGKNKEGIALVNVSRQLMYCSNESGKAFQKAIQKTIEQIITT